MEHVGQPLLLFFMCMAIFSYSYAEDFLQNPDFEIPPSNLTSNSTSQFQLVTTANPIPGWSFNGTIWYVNSGGNLSFPTNGHAIQLGKNGKIRQTLRPNDEVFDYILSFALVAQSDDCANNNHTAVNVSVHGKPYDERSIVFFLERNLSRNLWESHAFYLGRLGGDNVNLEITSLATNSQDNVTCWPIVDALTVIRHVMPRWYDGTLLANGGFEVGPAFLKNSSEGILLDEEQDRFNSPLQEWSIFGTIKYIDSKNYKVPRGKAAIQLLSGDPSGIHIDLHLQTTLTYTLNFTMGDANDSCVGDFVVYVQVGNNVHDFTMRSNGTGSAFKHSITFKSESESMETLISFHTFNETRRSDGVLCGPVLDSIVLFGSDGGKSHGERIGNGVLISCLFTVLAMLII